MKKYQEKPKMTDNLPNIWPIPFKSFQIMKYKNRQKDCFNLKNKLRSYDNT